MYGTLISVDAAKSLLDNNDTHVVVVDCRYSLANVRWGHEEYSKSHIAGAVYADMNIDLSAPVIKGVTGRHPLPDVDRFTEWIRDHGISNQTQVIAYDQAGGGMAARLWWLMRWLGHDSIAVLDGGWAVWQKAGLPVTDEVPLPRRSAFIPSLRNELIVDVDEVGQWACDAEHTVVDSREAHRYQGIEEPIDPVAGHIPGAINKPFGENIRPDGSWKTPGELRQRFASLLERCKDNEIAFYCGSGVTACHNILAFKHAGLGDARLYPGSWSEWITDETRGVEVESESEKVRK